MGALTDLTMAGALAGLAKGEFSSRELTDAHLQAMEKHRGLNAFVTETPDRARAMADASDKRRREGQIGAMEGLPIGIKDLFCTEGVATMAGSHILEGFKPTYGRCSRWGIVAFASSLDQAGPMAKTVRDCAILLENMCGFDPKDATSLDLPVPQLEVGLSSNLKGKRVGIPKEYRIDGVPDEINAIWDQGIAWLKDAGAEIVEISLPHTKYALPTYYIIAPAEASSNLARYDGVRYGLREMGVKSLDDMYAATRDTGFGAEVKRRIMIGTYVLSAGYYDAYFTKAQKVRTLIKRDFTQAFEECDLILTPTAPSAAFGLGEKMSDPLAMYLNDVFAVPASLAGLPAMSVPGGLDALGLPLGLHLIGRECDEQSVLNAGLAIEERAGFTARAEKWW